jgi:predicted ATPase
MREELTSWFFYYLEPRERMRIPSPVKEVRHIGMMGEELAAFLNTLHAVDEVQFKAVEKALNMVVPSITGIDVSVNNYGEVELNLMEGLTPIPARVVSEGTLRVLGLLALSGAKDRPSLIGFEEPENGIHPRRMRLIASLLRTRARSDTQVIVTTHSPLLSDLIPHESLFVCRKRKGHTMIEPFSVWELPNVGKALDDEEELLEYDTL